MINKNVSCTEKVYKDIPLHNSIPYSNMGPLASSPWRKFARSFTFGKAFNYLSVIIKKKNPTLRFIRPVLNHLTIDYQKDFKSLNDLARTQNPRSVDSNGYVINGSLNRF